MATPKGAWPSVIFLCYIPPGLVSLATVVVRGRSREHAEYTWERMTVFAGDDKRSRGMIVELQIMTLVNKKRNET